MTEIMSYIEAMTNGVTPDAYAMQHAMWGPKCGGTTGSPGPARAPRDANTALPRHNSAIQHVEFERIFQKYDKDRNRRLDKKEFYDFIKAFGVDVDRLTTDHIFASIKHDHKDYIGVEELHDFFMTLALGNTAETLAEIQLQRAFMKADQNGSGTLNFTEFAEYAWSVRRSYTSSALLRAFEDMEGDGENAIDYQHFKEFFTTVTEQEPPTAGSVTLENYLKNFCDVPDAAEMATFMKKRIQTDAKHVRESELLHGAEVVAPSANPQYKLLDLACFNDSQCSQPVKRSATGVLWESARKGNPGRCVFASDFDGVLPSQRATTSNLAFYGGNLLDPQQVKFSLLYRHTLVDFTYENVHHSEETFAHLEAATIGLERHTCPNLFRPLEDDSGHLVLGKLEGSTLHLTAYKVPVRQTIYIPSNIAHSRVHMRGTWRVMSESEDPEIDYVQLFKSLDCGRERCTGLSFTLMTEGKVV